MKRREFRDRNESEPERYERIRNETPAELAKRARHYRQQVRFARRLADALRGRRSR